MCEHAPVSKNPQRATGSTKVAGRTRRPGPARVVLLLLGLGLAVTMLLALRVILNWDLAGVRRAQAPTAQTAAGEAGPAPVQLDMEGFDPGHLIDDAVFYDSQAMSPVEVASFIRRVNRGCVPGYDGTVCLSQVTVDTEDMAPTTACPGGYEGATAESAASVISKVASACDVNPQVLLVLLQKEQGLLTASGGSLTSTDYASATGYACPDGGGCDQHWSGLFRQLYGAASQFQLYRLDPSSYRVVAGVPGEVSYSPHADCGGAPLLAVNQATAGLYDYTPFQPNPAAWQGGDYCTSWGNWNFYGIFRAWFGDPTPST